MCQENVSTESWIILEGEENLVGVMEVQESLQQGARAGGQEAAPWLGVT